jgi:hypothetical protein
MADKKISALPAATTPLAGTEVLPVVQGGVTDQVSVANLTAGRAVSATGYTATNGGFTSSSGGVHRSNSATESNSISNLFYAQNAAGTKALNMQLSSTNLGSVWAYNGSAWVEGWTITSAGDFKIPSKNVVIGTAGKGIDFSANGGDVLSQYDEGTWTPVITGSSSNPTVTYGLQRGKYVRVGNVVTASLLLTWSAISGGSGDVRISLPIAGESSVGVGGAGVMSYMDGITFAAGRTFCGFKPEANVLYGTIPQMGSVVTTSNTAISQLGATGYLVISVTYLV